MSCTKEFIEFAHYLADRSGELIQSHYQQDIVIEHKADASPVTIADRQAEKLIRKAIHHTYPDHGIVGEEYENRNEDAEYVWVLDPIDGTVSFTIGRPIFASLIALLHRNKPVLSVVNQPITEDRWLSGVGIKAHWNGKSIKTSSTTNLAEVVIATTGPNYFTDKEWRCFQNVSGQAKRVVYGGDCYNYALLASGTIDLVIESGLKLYDYAALIPLVEAAGGAITDWQGHNIICDVNAKQSVIAAANKTLLEKAVHALC